MLSLSKWSFREGNGVARALKALLVAILLWLVWHQGGFSTARLVALSMDPAATAVASLLLLSAFAMGVLRWRMLLLAKGIAIPASDVFRIGLVGEFFGTVLPGGSVSGEVAKLYLVRKRRANLSALDALSSIIVDRLLGLLALVSVVFLAGLLNLSSAMSFPAVALGGIGATLLVVAALLATTLNQVPLAQTGIRRVEALPKGTVILDFLRSIRAYRHHPDQLLVGFVISLFAHIAVVLAFVVLAQTIGGFESVRTLDYFLVVPLSLLVAMLPVAPGGLGTGHAAFFVLFQQLGSTAGADLFTIFLVAQLSLALAGGLVYAHRGVGRASR